MADLAQVQQRLLDWYGRQARDLPWRQTRDPYAILVAEVMLQQTQVDRVIPKWYGWLEQFPTLRDLAAASRADAIRAWQGLGYNLRAVRLHAIAVQAVAEFGGELPRSVEELVRLKGIGRYTAAAVACFAYEQPVAPVDTNIRRVLSRVFEVEPAHVEAMAEALVPADDAYAWNQALMDLGATLCRAAQPLCLVCPLLAECGGPRASRPRKPQGEFSGSNRYYRGRILDALRQLERVPVDELVAHHGGRLDLLGRLEADGLIAIEDGQVRLAG
jgi:A/G-specific adenine glycosylase